MASILPYGSAAYAAPVVDSFGSYMDDGELPVCIKWFSEAQEDKSFSPTNIKHVRIDRRGEILNDKVLVVVGGGAYTGAGNTFYTHRIRLISTLTGTKSLPICTFYQSMPFFYEATSMTDEVSVTESVLNKVYQLVELGDVAKAVKVVFARIEGSFVIHDLDAINEFLAKANVELLPVRVLVAMLRSSSRSKVTLFAWQSLFKRSISKANQEGLDTERLFWGLK